MSSAETAKHVLFGIASFIGQQTSKAAKFSWKNIKDLYDLIDPDAKRHAVQLPALAHSLLVPREKEIAPLPDDGHPPLVFVHGLGGNRGNFWLMSLYLRLHGRKRFYSIHFKAETSIEERAAELAKFIRKVKKQNNAPKVDIVAHSLGGIISRLAIKDHRLGKSVSRLITLGSPHKGTYSARYGYTEKIVALRPDSTLIQRLNKWKMPKGIKCVTFWSKSDLVIMPPESAALEKTTQVDMTPFTHFSYLIDPKCFARVSSALG